MSLSSAFKCLFCLIKCSKYLYYIKKAVCLLAVAVIAVAGLTLLSGKSCTLKKLKEML